MNCRAAIQFCKLALGTTLSASLLKPPHTAWDEQQPPAMFFVPVHAMQPGSSCDKHFTGHLGACLVDVLELLDWSVHHATSQTDITGMNCCSLVEMAS